MPWGAVMKVGCMYGGIVVLEVGTSEHWAQGPVQMHWSHTYEADPASLSQIDALICPTPNFYIKVQNNTNHTLSLDWYYGLLWVFFHSRVTTEEQCAWKKSSNMNNSRKNALNYLYAKSLFLLVNYKYPLVKVFAILPRKIEFLSILATFSL